MRYGNPNFFGQFAYINVASEMKVLNRQFSILLSLKISSSSLLVYNVKALFLGFVHLILQCDYFCLFYAFPLFVYEYLLRRVQ